LDFSMLIIPPPESHRKKRPKPRSTATPPGPPALVLVSATYSHFEPAYIVLGFDRAIDISALDGSAIGVDDGTINSILYDGTGGASLVNATTVKIFLTELGYTPSAVTVLNASASSGIVAVDDGGTWPGVTDRPV
jgi:hypothetical protein